MVTNLDRGFWHTLILLFKNPAKVIRDVISGVTLPYYDPFRYVFIWATISALFIVTFDVIEFQNEQVIQISGLKIQQTGLDEQQILITWVKKFLNIIPLIIIPFVALAGLWVFNRLKFNYAEHLVINGYLFGQVTMINILIQASIFLGAVFILISSALTMLVNIGYYALAFKSLGGYSVGGALWRSLALYILGNLLLAIFALIVGGIASIFL